MHYLNRGYELELLELHKSAQKPKCSKTYPKKEKDLNSNILCMKKILALGIISVSDIENYI